MAKHWFSLSFASAHARSRFLCGKGRGSKQVLFFNEKRDRWVDAPGPFVSANLRACWWEWIRYRYSKLAIQAEAAILIVGTWLLKAIAIHIVARQERYGMAIHMQVYHRRVEIYSFSILFQDKRPNKNMNYLILCSLRWVLYQAQSIFPQLKANNSKN